jgi:hypothetical protein
LGYNRYYFQVYHINDIDPFNWIGSDSHQEIKSIDKKISYSQDEYKITKEMNRLEIFFNIRFKI